MKDVTTTMPTTTPSPQARWNRNQFEFIFEFEFDADLGPRKHGCWDVPRLRQQSGKPPPWRFYIFQTNLSKVKIYIRIIQQKRNYGNRRIGSGDSIPPQSSHRTTTATHKCSPSAIHSFQSQSSGKWRGKGKAGRGYAVPKKSLDRCHASQFLHSENIPGSVPRCGTWTVFTFNIVLAASDAGAAEQGS